MDLETAFSLALKSKRKDSGLSQEQLALAADLDRTYVSLLERGLRQPSLRTIFQLSKALSIAPEALISEVKTHLNENS